MKYTTWDESNYRHSVEKTLAKVQSILGSQKVRLPEGEDYTYNDKYDLVEFVTNTSVAAQLTVLEHLGLTPDMLQTVLQWVQEQNDTVLLQFQVQDGCAFLKEQEVEVLSEPSTTTLDNTTAPPGLTPDSKKTTVTTRVLQKIKEYHWKVDVSYKLVLTNGTNNKSLELQGRNASTVLITSGEKNNRKTPASPTSGTNLKPISPIPDKTIHAPIEVSLTWLFQTLSAQGSDKPKPQFSIHQSSPSCKTPRWNDEVENAHSYHQSLMPWLWAVLTFFLDRLEKQILAQHAPLQQAQERLEIGARCQMVGIEKEPMFNQKHVIIREYIAGADRFRVEPVYASDNLPQSLAIKKGNLKLVPESHSTATTLSRVTVEDVLVPVLPLFFETTNGDADTKASSPPNAEPLLQAQAQSIKTALETQIATTYAPRQVAKLPSQAEAALLLLCTHWLTIIEYYKNGLHWIDDSSKQQLVQAIGAQIQSSDFQDFCRFHFAKRVFASLYAPRPFVLPVRRDEKHHPDGFVSIETLFESDTTDAKLSLPSAVSSKNIDTMVRRVAGDDKTETSSLFVPINAITSVEFTGDRFIHGWMQHSFGSLVEHRLVARARQFCNYILILGTMAGNNHLDPKAAIIVQNNEELVIPILTSVFPTAQEFQNAIHSLSPQQQAFCRAVRDVQLESSVFAFCIVQVKPQLERLLHLPTGALTREVQLTQDLITLFVEHHISSDLVSSGEVDADGALLTATAKLSAVKAQVKTVWDVIRATVRPTVTEKIERKVVPQKLPLLEEKESEDSTVGSFDSPKHSDLSMVAQASVGGQASSKTVPSHQQPEKEATAMITGLTKKSIPLSPTNDITLVPGLLEAQLAIVEEKKEDSSLRQAMIGTGMTWKRSLWVSSPVPATTLEREAIVVETQRAFNLLDALSRSGTLEISAELHAVIVLSQNFEKNVMGTVLEENENPIEKVERSALILGSAIYGKPFSEIAANPDVVEAILTPSTPSEV